jgi:hypothetical protein
MIDASASKSFDLGSTVSDARMKYPRKVLSIYFMTVKLQS